MKRGKLQKNFNQLLVKKFTNKNLSMESKDSIKSDTMNLLSENNKRKTFFFSVGSSKSNIFFNIFINFIGLVAKATFKILS